MSKVITQEMPVYGKIFVGNRDYYLLEPEPVKPDKVSWVQSNVLKFYAVNQSGFACYLYVSGNFFIDTSYMNDKMNVRFSILEQDDLEVVIRDDRIINALNEVDEELPF
jgi:hypothetical protein